MLHISHILPGQARYNVHIYAVKAHCAGHIQTVRYILWGVAPSHQLQRPLAHGLWIYGYPSRSHGFYYLKLFLRYGVRPARLHGELQAVAAVLPERIAQHILKLALCKHRRSAAAHIHASYLKSAVSGYFRAEAYILLQRGYVGRHVRLVGAHAGGEGAIKAPRPAEGYAYIHVHVPVGNIHEQPLYIHYLLCQGELFRGHVELLRHKAQGLLFAFFGYKLAEQPRGAYTGKAAPWEPRVLIYLAQRAEHGYLHAALAITLPVQLAAAHFWMNIGVLCPRPIHIGSADSAPCIAAFLHHSRNKGGGLAVLGGNHLLHGQIKPYYLAQIVQKLRVVSIYPYHFIS